MMNKIRIGWLKDQPGFVGGAEVSWGILMDNAPEWAELIYCEPRKRPPDVDAFIVQNNVQYDARWIEELSLKPVIKQVRDPWAVGDAILRRWLLDNAQMLIFNSKPHVDFFGFELSQPYQLIPPPVDVQAYREAALPADERVGNIFVGRVGATKGAHLAIDWALHNNEPLDLYGQMWGQNSYGKLPPNIRFHGFRDNAEMPFIMGRAKRLLLFPMWIESFGRVVAEAWAAGCELLVEPVERVGAMWWIENYPEKIGDGITMFWDAVEGVVNAH